MTEPKRDSLLIPESLVQLYHRMAKAFRSPTPRESLAIARLSRVVELHHRAAATIRVAIERSDTDDQERLLDLSSEETRLAHAVGELVTELGGSPPHPDECSVELPRDARSMSLARDQDELMRFVREDIEYVARAQRDLGGSPEIPIAIHQRLDSIVTNSIPQSAP